MLRLPLLLSYRNFHSTRLVFAGIEKSQLAALRKKTGYTFSNCKQALALNDNDVEKAEKWLDEQAQSLGWSKATKLAERTTAQGLVGIVVSENIGAMVEVNCETDFVARNEQFRSFVENVTKTCGLYTKTTEIEGDVWKLGFEIEALKHLQSSDGKLMKDQLALLIGNVGENVVIKRGMAFKSNGGIRIYGYTHPSPANAGPIEDKVQLGRCGAIVAFKASQYNDALMKGVCQHIVGMNPVRVGRPDVHSPAADIDAEECLIYQEFLVDPDRIVGDVLSENELTVIDFIRYDCGETVAQTRTEQRDQQQAN